MSAPPVEVSWFSALCDDDYEYLGVPDPRLRSSWEHCREIVLRAEQGGYGHDDPFEDHYDDDQPQHDRQQEPPRHPLEDDPQVKMQRAMIAGRRSIMPFQMRRASS